MWASAVHVLNVQSGDVLPSETAPHKTRSGILWVSDENEAKFIRSQGLLLFSRSLGVLSLPVTARRKSPFGTDCLQVPTRGSSVTHPRGSGANDAPGAPEDVGSSPSALGSALLPSLGV